MCVLPPSERGLGSRPCSRAARSPQQESARVACRRSYRALAGSLYNCGRVSSARLAAMTHEAAMNLALAQGARARDLGEVPIGCVVLLEDRVIGAACNRPITSIDPTAHAEVGALR